MLHSSMANAIRTLFALLLFTACDPENLGEIQPEMDAESEVESGYPRKVIVHTAYDFGFATFLARGAAGKVFAEDEMLVDMVENGEHISDVEVFEARAVELGGLLPIVHSWIGLEVQIANGPYIITEYDGNESILERDGVDWW